MLAQILTCVETTDIGATGMTLPVYLSIDTGALSISWQKFDELAIEVGSRSAFVTGYGTKLHCIDSGSIDLDNPIAAYRWQVNCIS